MSDSNSAGLPQKPSLDQLRKRAKELKASGAQPTLALAQLAIAREFGQESWPKLKRFVALKELRRSIEDGNIERLKALLGEHPALAKGTFEEGDTPLHLAAEFNEPAMIEAIVKAGSGFDARYSKSAHTALSWAVTTWSFDAANKLVELGCEPDLFCASGLGLLERVKVFWPQGKLAKHPSQTGSSRTDEAWNPLPRPPESAEDQVSDALYIACRSNRPEVAVWLLDHGADPNFRGYIGATPLHWAAFSGNEALCGLLRDRDASDDLQDYAFKATPTQFPAMIYAGWGFKRQLYDLLQKDVSQIATSTPIGTPLHAAASSGQADAIQILLHFGADKTLLNQDGETPAQVAARKGHAHLSNLLT